MNLHEEFTRLDHDRIKIVGRLTIADAVSLNPITCGVLSKETILPLRAGSAPNKRIIGWRPPGNDRERPACGLKAPDANRTDAKRRGIGEQIEMP